MLLLNTLNLKTEIEVTDQEGANLMKTVRAKVIVMMEATDLVEEAEVIKAKMVEGKEEETSKEIVDPLKMTEIEEKTLKILMAGMKNRLKSMLKLKQHFSTLVYKI